MTLLVVLADVSWCWVCSSSESSNELLRKAYSSVLEIFRLFALGVESRSPTEGVASSADSFNFRSSYWARSLWETSKFNVNYHVRAQDPKPCTGV